MIFNESKGLSSKFLFFQENDLSVNVIKHLWNYDEVLMISLSMFIWAYWWIRTSITIKIMPLNAIFKDIDETQKIDICSITLYSYDFAYIHTVKNKFKVFFSVQGRSLLASQSFSYFWIVGWGWEGDFDKCQMFSIVHASWWRCSCDISRLISS